MSEPQPPRRALRLTVFGDAAGGLNFLLSDGRNLALRERLALSPPDSLARWKGEARRQAAAMPGGLQAFGSAMAQVLLPASVCAALARLPSGPRAGAYLPR